MYIFFQLYAEPHTDQVDRKIQKSQWICMF